MRCCGREVEAGTHRWVRVGGCARAGTRGLGEKNNSFLAETLPKLSLPIHSPKYMTGGSAVRDMMDPNWVRKVFQIIRSL
jgi:hypothetical protein